MNHRSRTPLFILLGVVMLSVGLAVLGGAFVYVRHRHEVELDTKERTAVETKVTPTSTNDATSDVVDEDYRFKLKWLGKGYKVLGEAEAQRLVPNAKGGVIGKEGCALAVTAEYVPGAELDSVVDSVIDSVQGAGKTVGVRRAETRWGRDGVYFEVDTHLMGLRYHFGNFMVERQGWFERVVWWNIPERQKCPAFDEAVSFLDGDVTGRETRSPTNDEEHRLYRVKSGEYLNPSFRLRLTAPPATNLLAGREAAEYGAEAQVVVLAKGMHVIIESKQQTEGTIEGIMRWRLKGLGATMPPKADYTTKVGSQDLALYDIAMPKPFRTLLGAVRVDGQVLTWSLVYSPALRKEAEAFLDTVISRTTVLSKADAALLFKELPTIESDRIVADDRAIRSERFADYAMGIEAPLPPEPCLVSLAPVSGLPPASRLSIVHPTGGVFTAVLVKEAAANLEIEQRQIAAETIGLPFDSVRATTATSPTAMATRAKVSYHLGAGGDGTVVIDTFRRTNDWVHVVTWGGASKVDDLSPALDAFVGRMRFQVAPVQEVSLRGGHLEHARLGFAVDLPGPGWTLTNAPGFNLSQMVMYSGQSDRGSVALICIYLEHVDMDFLQGIMEQTLVQQGLTDVGVPIRTDTTLDGLPARRLQWPGKRDGIIAKEGSTFFAMVVSPSNGRLDPKDVYDGFRLLR